MKTVNNLYRKIIPIILLLFLVLPWGCEKDPFARDIVDDDIPVSQMELPMVNTLGIRNVTQTSAQSGGEVIQDGGGMIRSAGIVWAEHSSPTTDDFRNANGFTAGEFQSTLTKLEHSKTYYVRAYATNAKGTSYGEEFSFTTPTPLAPVITFEVEREQDLIRLRGKVTDYLDAVNERGFVWSLTGVPTIDGSKFVSDASPDVAEYFTEVPIALLNISKTYRIRAYTISNGGVSYGKTVYFNGTYPLIIDIDENVYTQVVIGTQTWMAENYKARRFRNGDAISGLIEHDPNYVSTYGQLYPGTVVTDPRNIAPEGWRVATYEDWQQLIATVGGSTQGGALKSTSLWNTPNVGATNSTGFTAIGGGFSPGGNPIEIGTVGFWWSSTVIRDNVQWRFALTNGDTNIYQIPQEGRGLHMSVRLIKE